MAVYTTGSGSSFIAGTVGNLDLGMLRQQSMQVINSVQGSLNGLYGQAATLFNNTLNFLNSENSWKRLEMATSASRAAWDPTAPMLLMSAEDFQTANPFMRQALMSNDYIWNMFQDNKLEGWDSDFNMTDNQRGELNYDWRRWNTGMVHMEPDGGWQVSNYTETENEALSFEEKVMIGQSIDNALSMIKQQHRDPTSYFNSKI